MLPLPCVNIASWPFQPNYTSISVKGLTPGFRYNNRICCLNKQLVLAEMISTWISVRKDRCLLQLFGFLHPPGLLLFFCQHHNVDLHGLSNDKHSSRLGVFKVSRWQKRAQRRHLNLFQWKTTPSKASMIHSQKGLVTKCTSTRGN